MKVFSTNPLVKDAVDKAFCLAREFYNLPNDEKLFGETAVICYLDSYSKEMDYATGAVGMALSAKNIKDTKKSSDLMARLFDNPKMETVDYFSSDDDGNVTRFTWIVFKIKSFKVDISKKLLNFNLAALVANIVTIFAYHHLVKNAMNDFVADRKIIFDKLKNLLMMTGTFTRIMREWKPRNE